VFLHDAAEEGVLGVLHEGLGQNRAKVPPAVWRNVQRQCTAQRIALRGLVGLLDTSLLALSTAGVDVVSLKGPVLSERLFGDPAARPFHDLDLLVAPNDLDRAVTVLASVGLRPERTPEERYFRQHQHHVHLYSPERLTLELHFKLTVNFGARAAAEEFMARAEPYKTRRGTSCRVLAFEDELLYLAQHAAGHSFGRLAWLYDLKVLLDRHPSPDWACIASRAASAGLAVPVALAFGMLRRHFGIAVPGIVGDAGARRQELARLLVPAARAARGRRGKAAHLLYEAILSDGLASAMRVLRRGAFSASLRLGDFRGTP
jgi:hypothetical protein